LNEDFCPAHLAYPIICATWHAVKFFWFKNDHWNHRNNQKSDFKKSWSIVNEQQVDFDGQE
jgi:hypothetical protein